MSVKPITGQYECVHSSGIGLEYFTARIDHLIIQANGRFILTTQNQSRAINAAQSFIKGQQATASAPETRLEGSYTQQNLLVTLQFEHGGSEQAQVTPDGTGMQIGPNMFTKVSDSTMLPPTHRLQKNMDDIAKGIKIASTLGGMAVKAAKTIQGTIQAVQEPGTPPHVPAGTPGAPTSQPQPAYPAPAPAAPLSAAPSYSAPAPQPTPTVEPPEQLEAVFCDQCGARCRPGKRFCNVCGARLA